MYLKKIPEQICLYILSFFHPVSRAEGVDQGSPYGSLQSYLFYDLFGTTKSSEIFPDAIQSSEEFYLLETKLFDSVQKSSNWTQYFWDHIL